LALDIIVKAVRNISVFILLSWLLSSCLGTRYLQENQKLLYRQKVKAPKGFSTAEIPNLYIQDVNRRLLGLPINTLVWMHHEGEKQYDQQKFIDKKEAIEKKFNAKISKTKNQRKITQLQFRKSQKTDGINKKIENGNDFMQWGEEATVFDSSNVENTRKRINDYLFTKGYFRNHVSFTTQEYEKRVSVEYLITPGPAYRYDSIVFMVADANIKQILEKEQTSSLIKKYDQYDQEKLNKERERIDLMLKDRGYYDFSRQYIEYAVDTAIRGNKRITLLIQINNPARRLAHKKFTIDSVIFTTDAGVNLTSNENRRQSERYRNITYKYYQNLYSKKILTQRVFITQDSLYSRNGTFNTQRQLANLDIFKFININYDTSGGKFVANIFSSALDRYSWSNEVGMTVTQGFPGPYFSTSFKKRNIFRGLEIIEINARFGFEGVASATEVGNFYKSTDAGVNGSITFPQFLFPFSEKQAFKYARFNPRTRLLAGYNYTDRPEYKRSITTLSDTYTWENRNITKFSLTLINLNIIRSKVDSAFNALLTDLQENQGNNLKNSFDPSFVSSVIFSITWNPNNYGNTMKHSHIIRFQIESGGTLFNFATPQYITDQGLALYQYVRANLDTRRSFVINKNTLFALRFNSGVAYSYNSGGVLPYEKYFFAGGSNSVRAWRPRRLGIGTKPPDLSANPEANGLFDYRYERPGDILLEGSAELRKKIFGFVSGAVFVDVGNVWSFREVNVSSETSPTTPAWQGSTKFSRGFIKEFGVGTGFGLRFDFSFLVLRLDFGIKAYDPAREAGDRFVLNKFKFLKPFGTEKEPVIFNIGIGYPF
jgi:outer membrane protein insertion porin family